MGCKLATVDDGKYHTEDSPITKRYNNMLNQLDVKYSESKLEIADMTVKGKSLLKEIGLSTPMIDIMEGINMLKDVNTKTKKYSDNVSVYVIYRSNGYDHLNALAEIQARLYITGMESIVKSLTGR